MKPGRELDTLVAKKVMGWPAPVYITDQQWDPAKPIYAWRECHRHGGDADCWDHAWHCGEHTYYPAPEYSTDTAAAWEVVEHMVGGPWYFESSHMGGGSAVSATARFVRTPLLVSMKQPTTNAFDAIAPTMPLAICLAALKATSAEAPA